MQNHNSSVEVYNFMIYNNCRKHTYLYEFIYSLRIPSTCSNCNGNIHPDSMYPISSAEIYISVYIRLENSGTREK